MAMKRTLLQIVQDILSDMDSEPVNSLADTNEADQIATVVEQTFYDIIATRSVPEHEELIKLVPLSDDDFPTHFLIPDNVTDVTHVWYDTSDDSTFEYTEIKWCDPLDFLTRVDKVQSDYQNVKDKSGNTNLRIVNNKHPSFYTSFDDLHIVMNSFKSTVDDTLQESKVRAYGRKFPVFNRFDDDYIPDIDDEFFPHLISEARARAMDLFKGGVPQKMEQAARRNKVHLQNDKFRIARANNWRHYGR